LVLAGISVRINRIDRSRASSRASGVTIARNPIRTSSVPGGKFSSVEAVINLSEMETEADFKTFDPLPLAAFANPVSTPCRCIAIKRRITSWTIRSMKASWLVDGDEGFIKT
jgi:hypothetical protein